MSLFSAALMQQAEETLATLRARDQTLATAESCTGGLISALLTEIPGSSDVFTHGFITYANDAKINMIGVPAALIEQFGAVSEPVAIAMAEGTLDTSGAGIAVSVTGIAGPGGGSEQKPVGLVHMAVAQTGQPTRHAKHIFSGDRTAIRLQAVEAALKILLA